MSFAHVNIFTFFLSSLIFCLPQCTCYPGWGSNGNAGGDCSERFCPFELSWVDGPSRAGGRHQYFECANKGLCNRVTGECNCFAGYEGKACGRQSCPEDCSGHGTCEYMKDLAFGIVYNEYNGENDHDLFVNTNRIARLEIDDDSDADYSSSDEEDS